jgi:hypothetical protein
MLIKHANPLIYKFNPILRFWDMKSYKMGIFDF